MLAAVLYGLAALSGLLLFCSDHPVHAWPLVGVAFVPILFALTRQRVRWWRAALAALVFGAVYNGALLWMLEFPVRLGIPLALALSLLWVIGFTVGARLVHRGPVAGPLAVAAVIALLEWVSYHAVPVWGTAQSFARVASAAPGAVPVASILGMTGVVFTLVAAQALIARMFAGDGTGDRRRAAGALAALLLLQLAFAAYLSITSVSAGSARVAAIGWNGSTTEGPHPELMAWLADAADRGAKLIATPEATMVLTRPQRDQLLADLGAFARERQVALAVGYFNLGDHDNRIAFVDRDGSLAGEYRKTHLIPYIEDYVAGDGSLVSWRPAALGSDAPLVGGMICQDDNFTDLARALGRARAQIVVVPTQDWAQVKDYHFENSRFRPIENGYAVVRPAFNGVSAVVDARGNVLAQQDHVENGPAVLVADLPLYEGGRPNAWIAGLAPFCWLAVLAAAFVPRRRRAGRLALPRS